MNVEYIRSAVVLAIFIFAIPGFTLLYYSLWCDEVAEGDYQVD